MPIAAQYKDENFLSFTPSDISLYIYNVKIGNCLSVSYSIQREVVALFAFGDPNAQGFNKGKRGIAGSLVFNVFQNHPILRSGWSTQVGFDKTNTLSDLNMKNNKFFNQALLGEIPTRLNANLSSQEAMFGGSIDLTQDSVRKQLQESYSLVASRALNYADQIPPFDIVMTFVNEMGDAAMMSINGCIIGNESGGYTMDDITSEMAFTFIARSVTPLQAFFPQDGVNRKLKNLMSGDLNPNIKFSRTI